MLPTKTIYSKIKVFLIFASILFLVLFSVLFFYKYKLEKQVYKEAELRFTHELNSLLEVHEKSNINALTDNSYWDDLVNAVRIKDTSWFNSNFSLVTASFYDFYAVRNSDFEIIRKESGEKIHSELNMPDSLFVNLKQKKTDHFFMNTQEGLLEVFAGSIHPTDDLMIKKTQPSGYLVLIKKWDDEFITNFEEILGSKIEIRKSSIANDKSISSEIQAKIMLTGWDGSPIAELVSNRNLNLNFNGTQNIFYIIMITVMLLLLLLYIMSDKLINKPLKLVTNILETDNKETIELLKKEPAEYGLIANLFESFVNQKQDLINAKESAEQQEYQIKAMFNAIPDMVFRMNTEGIFLDYKADINDLYYKNETIIGKKHADILPKYLVNMINKSIDLVMETNEVQMFEYVMEVPNKGKKDYEARMSKSGKEEVTAVVRDITEYKKTKIELIEAKEKAEESDRLKSAFLANMSHEIRTPMNSILGFSELLINDQLSKTKQKKYYEIVNSSGKRLMNLINDIIDISKIDANQLTLNYNTFSLNNMLELLHQQFLVNSNKTNVTLKVVKGLADVDSFICSDEMRLTQVISNLIENAFKFTKEGFIEFGYQFKNDAFYFYVKDSGVGIDEKDFQLIFERFGQSDNQHLSAIKGTGLGLSISKGIVELLGGKMGVTSEIQQGTSFYFSIQNCLAQKEVKHEIIDENNIIELDNTLNKTILIVEDDVANFMLIEAILETYPFKLIHAINGKIAIEKFQKNGGVDLILMDINMPVMNGYEATLEIRKINATIPIIAITAYAMESDREKSIAVGCTEYLSKPILKTLLMETIHKNLN